jgi:hypothetical protein
MARTVRQRSIEITADVIRLLTAWNRLAVRERDFYLREVEAAAVFWDCPGDDAAIAFRNFVRATLEAPADRLPAPRARALDTDRVRQFANAMVEQVDEACKAPPGLRPRLTHACAKVLGTALASEDREERCGAQLALSALVVQLVELVSRDD